MRINRHWLLTRGFKPIPSHSHNTHIYILATQENFDSVEVIHYPNEARFNPIVLADGYVRSGCYWEINEFYEGIITCLHMVRYQRGGRPVIKYHIIYDRVSRAVKWGCRYFTPEQLRLIKKRLEANYTKEQLE